MELEDLEDMIYDENINLIDSYLEQTSGAYIHYNDINVIMYDPSKIQSSNKMKEVFAEELGHYFCDATYKFNSDTAFISKQEYRAKKWSFYTLIPYNCLKSAIHNGIFSLYNLADYFNVTCEYMHNAVIFYTEKYGTIY